jgi:hypothetical protein
VFVQRHDRNKAEPAAQGSASGSKQRAENSLSWSGIVEYNGKRKGKVSVFMHADAREEAPKRVGRSTSFFCSRARLSKSQAQKRNPKPCGEVVPCQDTLLRVTVVCVLVLAMISALTLSGFGQTNAEPEIPNIGGSHNLTPLGKVLWVFAWSFGSIVLVIVSVLAVLRYLVKPSLYKSVGDAHWQEDALDEAGAQAKEGEVFEVCTELGAAAQGPSELERSEPEMPDPKHARLYSPASGPAWNEAMVDAFLCSCLKANCLGRAWEAEAAARMPGQRSLLPLVDAREAEFVRRLKARWQELHVDPDHGIYLEHGSGVSGKTRVCALRVCRAKHAVVWAGLNAGFVIESVGRYLRSSDVVCPGDRGCYYTPTPQEFRVMSPEEKKRAMRLSDIPDPWQAMIASQRGRTMASPWGGGAGGVGRDQDYDYDY